MRDDITDQNLRDGLVPVSSSIPLPTAAQTNLWDVELPEGLDLSVFPPAREHMWDPFWWDQAGRDPLEQRFIFTLDAGPERTQRLQKLVTDYPRYGPLMYEKCAQLGRADIIRELLSLGASLDIDWAKGKTSEEDPEDENGIPRFPLADMDPPLTEAAVSLQFECVKVLVEEAHVDVNLPDSGGRLPLTFAAAKGHLEMFDYLLAHGASMTFDPTADVLSDPQAAAQSGNIELFKVLLAHPQAIASNFKLGPEHLRYAANSGSLAMVEFVLEGAQFPLAPLSSSDMDMDLPQLGPKQRDAIVQSIVQAVEKGMLDALQLLLSYITPRRADGTFKFIKLENNIDSAVFNATEDAMEGATDIPVLFELVWETLLCPPQTELDASEEARELRYDWLHRRLISACAEGCPQTAKLLCDKYGANVNHVSHKFFTTPLSRAAVSNKNPLPPRLNIAKYLLEKPDIDIHLATGQYCNGPTALAMAVQVETDQSSMVKLLLDHGGPVEEVDSTLVEQARALAPNTTMPVFVMLFRDQPRFPVRLMTKEGHGLASADQKTYKVQLDLDAQAVEQLVGNVQIRKRDLLLAASDPKQRPLQQSEN